MRRRNIRRFVAALVLLLLIGTLYEASSEALDLKRYPPPGRMVEMGGYSLHLYCTGEGSPTVILEGGLGGGVATWPLVQPEVARQTRVCSYDRSGWAWSGGSPPASGREAAARLHTLLQNAGVQGPYLLVGHSLGGLYNQLFAAAYPDEVAGMVLVEARHQEFAQSLPPRLQPGGFSLTRLIGPVATRVGLVRAALHVAAALGAGLKVPTNMSDMAIRPSSQASANREQQLIPAIEAEVRAANLSLGDKPLEVITCDPALCSDEASQIWLETQRRYLTLSSQSHLAAAPGARHMVPYDNPAAVTDAILAIVQKRRP